MKKIGIEEVHQRVLGIAKEFDRICTKHNIPYFMVEGTMLGAIRHMGFIPWDDDMDFGVPYEYYDELREVLLVELQEPYRCCDYLNHPAAVDNFIKIEDTTTCIDDKAVDLPLEKKLGVNIDIFPLNQCKRKDIHMKTIRVKRLLLGSFYKSKNSPDSKGRKIAKKIIQLLVGGAPIYLQKSIARSLKRIKKDKYTGMFFTAYSFKDIMPTEWYGKGKRYEFEDTTLMGVEEYDKYLSQLYGSYMTPPPENKRRAHVENFYLR